MVYLPSHDPEESQSRLLNPIGPQDLTACAVRKITG